jgi:hypothetical protein
MISRPLQILLAVTLIVVVVMYFRNGEEPASLLPPPRNATPATAASTYAPASAMSASAPTSMTNLFPPQSWTPPSPPPTLEQAPKPTAPPLPFALAALWRDDQNEYVVLRAGTERFVLCRSCAKSVGSRPGSVLLHNYRIDSVNRNQVSFTFLPLQEKQVLHLGDQP